MSKKDPSKNLCIKKFYAGLRLLCHSYQLIFTIDENKIEFNHFLLTRLKILPEQVVIAEAPASIACSTSSLVEISPPVNISSFLYFSNRLFSSFCT
jgi:hypothetical protein